MRNEVKGEEELLSSIGADDKPCLNRKKSMHMNTKPFKIRFKQILLLQLFYFSQFHIVQFAMVRYCLICGYITAVLSHSHLSPHGLMYWVTDP